MTWLLFLILGAGLRGDISNTIAAIECEEQTKSSLGCKYKYLIVYDSKGKSHKFKLHDVQDKAIEELKALELEK